MQGAATCCPAGCTSTRPCLTLPCVALRAGGGDLLSSGLHEYQANPLIQALKLFTQRTLMPLVLMAITPNLVILLWYCAVHCDNSYVKLGAIFQEK